jgi:hypothetical protein
MNVSRETMTTKGEPMVKMSDAVHELRQRTNYRDWEIDDLNEEECWSISTLVNGEITMVSPDGATFVAMLRKVD